jgi:Flp pilus assembly protein TadB
VIPDALQLIFYAIHSFGMSLPDAVQSVSDEPWVQQPYRT